MYPFLQQKHFFGTTAELDITQQKNFFGNMYCLNLSQQTLHLRMGFGFHELWLTLTADL